MPTAEVPLGRPPGRPGWPASTTRSKRSARAFSRLRLTQFSSLTQPAAARQPFSDIASTASHAEDVGFGMYQQRGGGAENQRAELAGIDNALETEYSDVLSTASGTGDAGFGMCGYHIPFLLTTSTGQEEETEEPVEVEAGAGVRERREWQEQREDREAGSREWGKEEKQPRIAAVVLCG